MSRLDDLHIGKESSQGHAVHPQAWTRTRKKKPQPLFTIVVKPVIERDTLLLLLGNAWLMVGVALPVPRAFDAIVCFTAGIICFVLRR